MNNFVLNMILSVFLCILLVGSVATASETDKNLTTTVGPASNIASASPVPSGASPTTNKTCSANDTSCASDDHQGSFKKLMTGITENKDTLMRAFYVLLGVTAIVVVYFVVRTVRLRRRRSKSKKYGIISQSDDNMEMRPLDQDDDEDDMTVFDINHK